MSQRILSISGLRGVIGDGLDPQYLVQFAAGFGTFAEGGRVIVARDGRASGEMVRHAVLAGLMAAGCEVLDAGIASTPTLGVLVQQFQAAGGLQITASHNPAEWNGLKPFCPAGSVLDAEQGARLLGILDGGDVRQAGWQQLGRVESLRAGERFHRDRVLQLVDVRAIRQAHLPVVLDCNHGAGAVLGPPLLEALGCDVTVLGGTPDGAFEHTPEPLEQNLTGLCEVMRQSGGAVGFAQDPDADRLAIVDETGRYIGEELTLALCADHILSRRPGAVVVNGSTSRVTADIASRHGCPFHRSHVGEANVVAKMREVQAVIGGEGNGGLIEPRVGYVRDSFAAMAYVLAGMVERGQPLSQWVDSLPRYVIVKNKVTCARERVEVACRALRDHFPDASAQEGDGLRLDWSDRWVQVRASNTEPIIRVIAEAPDAGLAQDLCASAIGVVNAAVA